MVKYLRMKKYVLSLLSTAAGRMIRPLRQFEAKHTKTAFVARLVAVAVIIGIIPVTNSIYSALNRAQEISASSAVQGIKNDVENTVGQLHTAQPGDNTQAKNSQAANLTPATPDTKSNNPGTKYSTSPDPRSTAYSTTPPAPSPTDFMNTVTHSGQFAPGTLIGSNAVKQLKVYYGGDLVVNPASVSVSEQNGTASGDFTIKMPDGASSVAPSEPWNDQSNIAFAVQHADSAVSEGTSWTMFFELNGKPAPRVQPYLIHLQTTRSVGDDDWEYDAFVPLYVDN